jgi:hypothetical protein
MPTTNRSYPLVTIKPRARLVPDARPVTRTAPFSALEEDFFARAADLYPEAGDAVEEWDRLYAAVKAGL